MQWLNKIADDLVARHPKGGIVVSSGVSPSGTYHLGTLREVLTAEAIARELRRRGRQAAHFHVCDDLDVFRKVPAGVPAEFEKYLGKPLCDVPSPGGGKGSYSEYYLQDLIEAAAALRLDMEVVKASEKYRQGFFVEAIEIALENTEKIKNILESISGHKVDNTWSPVQVIEDGYLKNRTFKSLDKKAGTIVYLDQNGAEKQIKYGSGEVKLNWRVDWPARWWKLGVNAEPFGRDHATKGGSYDTGKVIVKDIFKAEAPLPIPYDFINRTGDTKKMSKSAGDVITAAELLEVLPPEVVWFFILRSSPDKQLYFDQGSSLIKLIDDFGELLAKTDKSAAEKQLLELCLEGINHQTISRVPFSHLVASYQASLKDPQKTLEIIGRTEYAETAGQDSKVIVKELQFIDAWLNKYAPEDVKFELLEKIKPADFIEAQRSFLKELAGKIEAAPNDADGAWFHQAIYEFKDSTGLEPKEMFQTLYRALIGKDYGPRAGLFLSMLPRDWLVKRLRLEA